jgi:hypothetical protein
MRKILFPFGLAFIFSCNNDATNVAVFTSDSSYTIVDGSIITTENLPTFKSLIWVPVFDSVKGDVTLKKQRAVLADTLTAENLIKEINGSWDGIQLQFRKVSNDTLYVAIPESTMLTQQLGSSGANGYMYSTTFILTELKQIKFVNFDFAEGDHLAPGTYKRSDFSN